MIKGMEDDVRTGERKGKEGGACLVRVVIVVGDESVEVSISSCERVDGC